MKILLHICCAPCSIYPFKELTHLTMLRVNPEQAMSKGEERVEGLIRGSGNKVTGFFYNPNIHPAEEEERRRRALIDYAEKENFEVLFSEYDAEDFFKKTRKNQEAPLRCVICWRMRLEKTAETAKAEKCDAFTTTLLVSPYQDQDAIKKIGVECEKQFGVEFLAVDFRNGFRTAQEEARNNGMYRQKYCGCIFSQKK